MTKKKKTRAKRKTATEMLAETNAKAKALEERIAMTQVMDNPQVLVFKALLEDLTKQTIEYQKGFGNGPQSFETRRLTHQLWVDEINAQRAYAEVALENIGYQRDYLKTEISSLAREVVNGLNGPKLDELCVNITQNIPALDEAIIAESKAVLDHATRTRQDHTLQKKMSKKTRKAT
jgi:hypothetical protein